MYAYFSGMNPKDLVLLAGGFLPERKQGALRLDRKDGRKANVQSLQIGESYTKEPQSITLQPWDHLEVPFDPEFQKTRQSKATRRFYVARDLCATTPRRNPKRPNYPRRWL
jgi:protein involved in polysaccharide export with SLBB domain